MCDDMLSELKQFMFYVRPPQLNVPVEHREKQREKETLPVLKSEIRLPQKHVEKEDEEKEKEKEKEHEEKEKEKEHEEKEKKVFIPRQKDTLFWCFYKIIHEELPENINIAMEKTLKIKYVEEMRKHKELIKKHKFASMSHIENQLANEEVIDITAFFVLSLMYNLNVVYIKNKTYFELIVNEEVDSPIYIIYFLEQSKYGYSVTKDKTIYNLFYKIDNLNKPIKAISSYKVSELIEICNKLSISIDDLKNKKHYYEAIIKKID
jgi:hypothetical protein